MIIKGFLSAHWNGSKGSFFFLHLSLSFSVEHYFILFNTVPVRCILKLCRHGVLENPLLEFDDFKNQSVVYVGVDGVLAGLIYVEDQIREDARHVVESLSKQGISTYLLSGDKKNAAEYVASVVGIPKENVSGFIFLKTRIHLSSGTILYIFLCITSCLMDLMIPKEKIHNK